MENTQERTSEIVANNNGAATLAKPEPTISQSFVAKVERQFMAEVGAPIAWNALHKALAQHLYLKIDAQLTALEIKRAGNSYKQNDPPITWANVNMTKLAIDATRVVMMELDASLSNHIHPIPYLNSRTAKYDLDLRVGYMGVDHVHRKFAIDLPLTISYELVHETDKFSYGRDDRGIAYVMHERTNPFAPGKVVGGFGYITYEDPRKNRVVLVEYREFEKAKKASKGVEFWGGMQKKWENKKQVDAGFDEKFEKEMQFKTVVHRVCKTIQLDSSKINAASLQALQEAGLEAIDAEIDAEMVEYANGDVVDVDPTSGEVTSETPAIEGATESTEAQPPTEDTPY